MMYTSDRKHREQMSQRKSPGRESSLEVTGMGRRVWIISPHVILHPLKALMMNTCFYNVNVMKNVCFFHEK